MKDPTANRAGRNIAADEYAVLTLLGAGGKSLYLDMDTTKALMAGVEIRRTLVGKFYGRIKKNAPGAAGTVAEGTASRKDTNS